MIMEGSFNTMLNAIDYLSKDRPVEDGVTPDVIVINHGTNDGGQSRKKFEEAMVATITRLQEKYPDTPIVYLIPFNQAHARVISEKLENEENIYVVETKDWSITYTDGVHPDATGAKYAGEKLASALVEIFGEDYFEN